MFFETRLAPYPEVSPENTELKELFLSGDVRKSLETIRLREKSEGRTRFKKPGDIILYIEIFRSCCIEKQASALSRLGTLQFPADPSLQIYRIRNYLRSGRFLAGFKFMESGTKELKQVNPSVWYAEMASLQADAGFEKTARDYIYAAQAESTAEDSAVTQYLLACAYGDLRDYQTAVKQCQKAVELAPLWGRARSYLLYLLLSIGDLTRADQLILECKNLQIEDASLDFYEVFSYSTESGPAKVEGDLKKLLEKWHEADFLDALKRSLFIAASVNGNESLISELLEETQPNEEDLIKFEYGEKASAVIHLPFVAQKRDECVPTSVAMIAYAQGIQCDPSELYKAMHGREGTPLWRMREWLHDNEFSFRALEFNPQNICSVIDMGVPLLGLVEGFLLSHVDVICGYHRELGMVFMRDPVSWMTFPLTYKEIYARHASSPTLYAILTKENEARFGEAIDKLDQNDPAMALIDLAESRVKGERELAEKAFGRIPQNHWAELNAVSLANRVVLTPTQVEQALIRIGLNEEIHDSVRFQALTRCAGEDVSAAIEEIVSRGEMKLNKNGKKLLRMFQYQAQSESQKALDVCDQLLNQSFHGSYIWSTKADLLQRLGRLEEAETALSYAIELEPLNINSRRQMLRLRGTRILPTEESQEIEEMLAEDSDNKSLLGLLAQVKHDGPDGLEFERVILEYLKYFPRDPDVWYRLLQWYGQQESHEKCFTTSQKAAEILPDSEAPSYHLPDKEENQNGGEKLEEPIDKNSKSVSDWLDIFSQKDHENHAEAKRFLTTKMSSKSMVWYEEARFRTLALTQMDTPSPFEISQILETPQPGSIHEIVRMVVEGVTSYSRLSPAVAGKVWDWMVKLVPDFRKESYFWFSAVLLLEIRGELEQALKELEGLLDEFPGDSSAVYRLGTIRYNQGRFQDAFELFQKCIELDPGLPGGLSSLLEVSQEVQAKNVYSDTLKRVTQKFPYHYRHHIQYFKDVIENRGAEAAKEVMAEAIPRFSQVHQTLFHIQYLLSLNENNEAHEQIQTIEPPSDDDTLNDYLSAKIQIGQALENNEIKIEACDEGLSRWPDSAYLLKIKGECLYETNPDESHELYKKAIQTSHADLMTVFYYLSSSKDPFDAAKECLNAPGEADEISLLAQIIQVFERTHFDDVGEKFLVWASKKYPEEKSVRESLVQFQYSRGNYDEASTLALHLHEDFPEDPFYTFLAGKILKFNDPKRGLEYLQKAYDQNKSTEIIFHLARCLHEMGSVKVSMKYYWEILRYEPTFPTSITNLSILGERPDQLWPYINAIISRGTDRAESYFLVVAVDLARQTGNALNSNWIQLAIDRYEFIQDDDSFKEEKKKLKQAIRAWLNFYPNPNHPLNKKFIFYHSMTWPGTKWIPRQS